MVVPHVVAVKAGVRFSPATYFFPFLPGESPGLESLVVWWFARAGRLFSATMAERFNINSQMEHLQMKYTGMWSCFLRLFCRGRVCCAWVLCVKIVCARVCVLSMLTGGARTGTGHPDITRYEWLVNHHRDSAAAYIGHAHLTLMFGVAENESAARVRYNLMQQMIAPCGREPKELRDDDDDDDE